MKRRWRLGLGIALLPAVAGAPLVVPEVYWRGTGWARGEAFYQGRPTRYWAGEVRRCPMVDSFVSGDLYFFPPDPDPSLTERWLTKLGVRRPNGGGRPYPLGRDPAAVPVLLELLAEQDVKVRLFAIQSLGLLGPAAEGARPALREEARTTQDYLVYREAKIALGIIDRPAADAAGLDRPDEDQLWERYKAALRSR